MKKFKTEYLQKYLIQGDFESNFISVKPKTDDYDKQRFLDADGRYKFKEKMSFNSIELVGRHKITNAKIIKSLPIGIEDKIDAFKQKNFLKFIDLFPLKSQKKPFETEKRWNNNYLNHQ